MSEKLITGLTAYRIINTKTEWLVTKTDKDSEWELPKSLVRRGESSVSALIRAMQDDMGLKGRIIEEAGRNSLVKKVDGEQVNEKHLYYVARTSVADETNGKFAEKKWTQFSRAQKLLGSVREQKILQLAQEVLKECRKENKKI